MKFDKKSKMIAMICFAAVLAIAGTLMLNYGYEKDSGETMSIGAMPVEYFSPSPSPLPTAQPTPSPAVKITVHIKGEVANPGLYELDDGARVSDAIAAAGGLTPNAGEEYINLALKLCDQDEINIPSKSSGASEAKSASSGSVVKNAQGSAGGTVKRVAPQTPAKPTPSVDNKVNINTAGAEELDMLPGIGPAYAKNIIDYRSKNGAFETIQDIMKVTGIGEKRFEAIKDLICIK